jgi:hypothetical protein
LQGRGDDCRCEQIKYGATHDRFPDGGLADSQKHKGDGHFRERQTPNPQRLGDERQSREVFDLGRPSELDVLPKSIWNAQDGDDIVAQTADLWKILATGSAKRDTYNTQCYE